MIIKKGQQVKCIKTVIMENGSTAGKAAYQEGKIYNSENDNCITDEFNNRNHGWTVDYFKEYFTILMGRDSYSITRQQMREIYNIACSNWKNKIEDIITHYFKPIDDIGQLPYEIVKNMFDDATSNQIKVLQNIFPEYTDFKDGDIVVSESSNGSLRISWIAIVKGYYQPEYYNFYCSYLMTATNSSIVKDSYCCTQTRTRLATVKECQILFDKLRKEHNLLWDADAKKLIKGNYIEMKKIDLKKCIDNKDFTQYFPTKELQDEVMEWPNELCGNNNFFSSHPNNYKVHYGVVSSGVCCSEVNCTICPFNNKKILLSMKPFNRQFDKEGFEKWRQEREVNLLTEPHSDNYIYALNELFLCAKYLNGDWKLDLSKIDSHNNIRYSLYYNVYKDNIEIHTSYDCCTHGISYFKTEELARKAIEILGKETIINALSISI